MRARTLLSLGPSKLWLILFVLTFLANLMLSKGTYGQGLELSGGWAHVTGDFGTDGFNVGAAW